MPELVFKGKEYVYNHHLTVPYRPLIPHAEKSIGPADLAGNLIIHGDNLHALKSLVPRYAGKVDLIFIDPPYNTGNENWSYNDNVNSPIMREWLRLNPVDADDMLRHDKWLCMMWPRLTLLRDLLSDRGTLWMTLDTNEVHRAKSLLDEIFGDANFLGFVTYQANPRGRQSDTHFATVADYVLCYAKEEDSALFSGFEPNEEYEEGFREIGEDNKKWRELGLRQRGVASLKEDREDMHFPIYVDPRSGAVSLIGIPEFSEKVIPKKSDGRLGRWSWSQTKVREEAARVYGRRVGKHGRWDIFYRDYFERPDGPRTQKPKNLWTDPEVNNEVGSRALKSILPEEKFDHPKPVGLIEKILSIATMPDSIILDSFAGSGTTAHAVLKANAKDVGNRKFVLVECENYADRITAERVRRVIQGYAFQGVHREELFRERLNWSVLQKADELITKVEAIKAREGFAERTDLASAVERRFDKLNVKVENGELVVEGEKRISERVEGLGGEFTFSTLGEPIDPEGILSGKTLPDYENLGAWLYYTATGGTLNKRKVKAKDWYLGEAQNRHLWLVYKPDLGFLKSAEAALTLSLAKKLREKYPNKGHLVFAPAKFLSNKQLLEHGVEYAPLPFALYRET